LFGTKSNKEPSLEPSIQDLHQGLPQAMFQVLDQVFQYHLSQFQFCSRGELSNTPSHTSILETNLKPRNVVNLDRMKEEEYIVNLVMMKKEEYIMLEPTHSEG
jgi:hypothetical protein